jgi:hypothetical protein
MKFWPLHLERNLLAIRGALPSITGRAKHAPHLWKTAFWICSAQDLPASTKAAFSQDGRDQGDEAQAVFPRG